MAQVTSGKVTFSRTVQPAEYESARAEVELAFVVDEREKIEDVLEDVGGIAKDHALRMVAGMRERNRRRSRR